MSLRSGLLLIGGAVVVFGLAVGAYLTRENWRPWPSGVTREKQTTADGRDDHGHDHGHEHGTADRIMLSEQAQKNLRLVVEPLLPESYSRSLQMPGIVADRPGLSDRGVTTPIAGVVTAINIQPGDTVRPGEALFTIRLLSEVFLTTQSELFKATKEFQLNRENLNRLKSIAEGAIAQTKVIELMNQESRLLASIAAYKQELQTRGLNSDQINAVAAGKFVSEIDISAPAQGKDGKPLLDATPAVSPQADPSSPAFEVKVVRVQVGEQVQAGQALCTLANYRQLYVEGRAFKQDAGLLEKAAQQGWPVKAEFAEESNGWPSSETSLYIRHISNTVDPVSRTFAFYLELANQSRTFTKDGKTFLIWRFRPGQRVRLKVPVQQYEDVFVLPAEAIVREGAEVFAFRQNGNFFERKPVHTVLEDRDTVLIANDGSLAPGAYVARNGAAALNRALKAKAATGGGHEGHDHSHGH